MGLPGGAEISNVGGHVNDESSRPGGERKRGEVPASAELRRVRVAGLLVGAREVILEHDGQSYRLRVTSNGKLILTK